MSVTPIPCLKDNYAYLVTCDATGKRAVVDPSEAEPVLAALGGAKLDAIWNTHHHWDHVGGNEALVQKLGVTEVAGHASDRGRIACQTRFLEEGDAFELGALRVRVLHIPGHTTGAVAYVVEGDGAPAVFTGDTLFVAGCGRLFEGTPAMMFESLKKLAALPGETRVYCGHEYTAQNLRFAAHAEPQNADIAAAARAVTVPSVPSTIAAEKRINPFVRAPDPAAFATLRAAKDKF